MVCHPRLVLVGAGRWGLAHARTVQEAGGRLVAVVDVNIEAAERAAEAYGARAYQRLEDAVEKEKPDAAIIAVPPQALASVAREALGLGLHVLVEKPVALEARSAGELAGFAESRGLVGVAGYLLRFHPVTRILREIVSREPLLLEFYRVIGRPDNARRWPIDLDLAVHDVDLSIFLLGGEPRVLESRLEERGGGSIYELLLGYSGTRVRILVSDAVAGGVKYRVVKVFTRSLVAEAFYDDGRVELWSSLRRHVSMAAEKPLTLEHRAFYMLVCGASLEEVEEKLGARPATLRDAERVLRVIGGARRLVQASHEAAIS